MTSGSRARIEVRNLHKTFGLAKVLSGVDFTVDPGEVHGLAGQNGSGKSTLIKVITGIYTPDAGAELEIDGASVRLPVRWAQVHAAGVSVVHQDLGLLDELSVADNICVGGYPSQRFTHRIDRHRQHEVALRSLRRVGADIDPGRLATTLTAPERAEIAVARALRDHQPGEGLVIMDESTRTLVGADLARVHGILRTLASEGTSVILISHSLPELLAVTDRVTILRDGQVSGAGLKTTDLTEQEIARRMLGSDALNTDTHRGSVNSKRGPRSAAPTLELSALAGRRVRDISFAAGHGEIVGITGLPGSGYEDIPYLMTGAIAPSGGRLKIGHDDFDLPIASISRLLRAGIVLVPEQRIKDGLALELTVRDNISLPNLSQRGRPWFLGQAWQRREADDAVRRYGIRPHDIERLVKTLSGGNQQKVLLAKWLGAGPKVLVLHEPTQAVDVGARRDILLDIRRAADDSVAIVMVSGEPSDLCAICDRIYLAQTGGGLVEIESRNPDDLLELIYSQHPVDEKD